MNNLTETEKYKQQDALDSVLRDHYDRVSEIHGIRSTFSYYDVTNMYDKHPFTSATFVIDSCTNKSYAIDGDLWVDVWIAIDQCIFIEGPTDYTFIEDMYYTPGDNIVKYSTGS
jgi:hypothetical protein